MQEIPFVKEEHAEKARTMEEVLMEQPEDTGVDFAAVNPSPTLREQDPIYNVLVGCSRLRDTRTVESVVHMALSTWIDDGAQVNVVVRKGTLRT